MAQLTIGSPLVRGFSSESSGSDAGKGTGRQDPDRNHSIVLFPERFSRWSSLRKRPLRVAYVRV